MAARKPSKAIRAAIFFALSAVAGTASAAEIACTYDSRAHKEMVTIDHCAVKDAGGRVLLKPAILQDIRFDRQGLASVHAAGWRYLRRDGRAVAVMTMDNGPDPFVDGRARAPVGSKIGYVDASLRFVIQPRYDGAYPFSRGMAVVCMGCKPLSEGEYSSFAGGAWSCIDRSGRALRPFRPNRDVSSACRARR